MRGDAPAVGSCRRRAARGVAGSGLQPGTAARGRALLHDARSERLSFPVLFAFGSLPPKPAHIEQNVFEAQR